MPTRREARGAGAGAAEHTRSNYQITRSKASSTVLLLLLQQLRPAHFLSRHLLCEESSDVGALVRVGGGSRDAIGRLLLHEEEVEGRAGHIVRWCGLVQRDHVGVEVTPALLRSQRRGVQAVALRDALERLAAAPERWANCSRLLLRHRGRPLEVPLREELHVADNAAGWLLVHHQEVFIFPQHGRHTTRNLLALPAVGGSATVVLFVPVAVRRPVGNGVP
eukprot:scaffold86904_cov63-Phaeocystis_antarctica.AAC.2